MGDHELPYWLLKKVMLTCQQTDFAKISLAVNRLSAADDELLEAEGLPDTASVSPPVAAGGAS
jgi:hypothetical protein